MPVPYRKTPRAAETGCAAYLDIFWIPSAHAFFGALLLVDGRGQPMEFVHNTLTAPSGFLWPEEQVREAGIAMLAHSLFDACRREPDLLVCRATLGTPDYCKAHLAPSIPFAQVVPATGAAPAEWSWINEPPTPGMRAHALYQELSRRGFALEPFERLYEGLRTVYPHSPWQEAEHAAGSE